MVIIFSQALKQKHDYDVTKYFDYVDSKSVARFIVGDMVFDTLNCTLILRI